VNELKGVTTVLIEHDMDVVMDVSDHVTVLNFGGVIGDGTPDDVRANTAVIEAYLGEEEDR
jgi:branched-chain amino acid transport system ATP-binding protein